MPAGLGQDLNQFITSNPSLNEASKTWNAFSGCDIIAYIGHKRVATLQGVTVSITRETMPVFTMGDPNAKAFVRGKRAIAGNLVFTQFDKHAILEMTKLLEGKRFVGDLDVFAKRDLQGIKSGYLAGVNNTVSPVLTPDVSNAGYRAALENELAQTYAIIASRRLKYSDQVPPFDITITMGNELGQVAYTAINSVQLVNEAWGFTIDDLTSEMALTFVARSITPLNNVLEQSSLFGASSTEGMSVS